MQNDRHEIRCYSLADVPPRWGPFAISFTLQALGLALLVHFGVIQPRDFAPHPRYEITDLIAPKLAAVHPSPPPLHIPAPPKRMLDRILTPQSPSTPPPPQLPKNEPMYAAVPAPTPPPVQPQVAPPQFPNAAPQPLPGSGSPKRDVQLNSFSSGSSAVATLNKPASQVQTGGFGDPNGVAPNPNGHGIVKIAAVGSFDLPTGPGTGNGTGGAHGARGTVASAGFGDGVAGPGGSGSGPGLANGGAVQDGGFNDNTVAEKRPAKAVSVEEGRFTPAEVLSKPTPAYTEEARQQKIEGEVLLEVVFSASGDVRVVRVVHGLGHGLDEAAIHAAQQIRFKPAQRGGRAVDSTGKLHIIFQLS